MRWLGDNHEKVEDGIFHVGRDLFSEFTLAFFDTTSIYFEGAGGFARGGLGKRGHSKDHRPDLKPMVVGAVLDGEGRPVSCPMPKCPKIASIFRTTVEVEFKERTDRLISFSFKQGSKPVLPRLSLNEKEQA